MTIVTGKLWVAVALAILLVVSLRLSTPVAKNMTDGVEYLKVASVGLEPQGQLAAPFVYRFAVPLFVHGVSLVTGTLPVFIFPVVTFAACIALLIAVYTLSLLAGASRGNALLVLLLLGSSLFMIRFPLYCPYEVDVEACAVSFVAFACLLRRSYVAALGISLVGLLFKEFLLAPLVVISGLSFGEYLRRRTIGPLRWTVLSVALTVAVFLLPRVLIPVTYSYGAILQLKTPEPSQSMYFSELRYLLAWPPELGTPINVLLALISLWLPALMLMTGPRSRMLWQGLGSNRALVVLWMSTVVALMLVGGTKIMVFATYSAPVLVLVLSLLLRTGAAKAEIVLVLIGTVIFNRMIFGFGLPGGEPGPDISFYGAYWHNLTGATAWRYAEITGWIVLSWGIRRLFTPVRSAFLEGEVG